ncbi:hypothetical protein BpHYR1_049906 [Brachionus plicatilis]|uniref:Uncharacterized protein n=1 Tax=Brachionus plicatilis TaxID=10195 RepID=A0A3M7QFG4_BRAPC|nr:hypothetical protein BpHYR1_049906 [Brachionus plicatilis]
MWLVKTSWPRFYHGRSRSSDKITLRQQQLQQEQWLLTNCDLTLLLMLYPIHFEVSFKKFNSKS